MREGQHEAIREEKVTLVIVRWVRVSEAHEGGHVGIGWEEWVHACLHIAISLDKNAVVILRDFHIHR